MERKISCVYRKGLQDKLLFVPNINHKIQKVYQIDSYGVNTDGTFYQRERQFGVVNQAINQEFISSSL